MQWIALFVLLALVHTTTIYLADSVIHPLKNWDQVPLVEVLPFFFNRSTISSQFRCSLASRLLIYITCINVLSVSLRYVFPFPILFPYICVAKNAL